MLKRATPSLMDRKLLFVRFQLEDLAQKPVSLFTESGFPQRNAKHANYVSFGRTMNMEKLVTR